MIRRALFTLLFAVSLGVAGTVGYYVNEYRHLKKDYEDLRVIARDTLMESEQHQTTATSCLATLKTVKSNLYLPTLDLNLEPTVAFAQRR